MAHGVATPAVSSGKPRSDIAVLAAATALIRPDRRKDHGEDRYQALIEGFDGKPYVVVFTMPGDTLWLISFRRVRARESGSYVEKA